MYWIFFLLNFIVYIFSFKHIINNGGLKRHIPFSLCLFILFIYTLVTPTYYYSIGYVGIYELDIRDYYIYGLLIFLINIFSFSWGYIGFNNSLKERKNFDRLGSNKTEEILKWTFYSLFLLVLGNLLWGGVDIANLFNVFSSDSNKSKTIVFSVEDHVGYSNYLGNFADSLITCIVFGALIGLKKRTIITWAVPSLFLFALMGFRYRIILVLIGLFYVFIIMKPLSFQRWRQLLFIISISFYGVLFFTQNRFEFARREFDKISLVDFSNIIDEVSYQTRGGLADISLFRLYDKYQPDFDYGETMVTATVIRALPAFVFSGNVKPEPAWKDNLKDLWKDARYKPWGEALTIVGFHYAMIGIIGVAFFSFLIGFLIKRIQMKTNYNSKSQVLFLIIVSLTLFQYCTRGYFPQVVDHFIFLSVPYFILMLFRKKIIHQTGFE